MSETIMQKFKDLYKGQTVWVVGKGPSLQYLTKGDIGPGPVIAINQAIIKIEEFDLPNPIFSMQKDGGDRRLYRGKVDKSKRRIFKPDCDYTPDCGDKCGNMVRPKKGAILLVHKHESLYCMPDYSPRYVFDWMELGLGRNIFSQIIAIKIGVLMGCEKFHFISFDFQVNGCLEEYIPNVGVVGIRRGYKCHLRRVKRYLMNLDHKWITPIGK